MKGNKKKVLDLFTVIIICILLTTNNINFNDVQKNDERSVETRNETNLKSPKKSATYPESFIHIDGSIADNWSDTESTYGWCSGNGFWGNPYIIENVTINAGGTGSGIFINNSKNVYFIVRNCNVTNAGSVNEIDAGIKLENTFNGTLTNNNCSDNGHAGIILRNDCDYNTISGNIVNDCSSRGI